MPGARPNSGDVPALCAYCGGLAFSGAPECEACTRRVNGIVEETWAQFATGQPVGSDHDLAAPVVAEPDRYDWRVVDAAYDHTLCEGCGAPLSQGVPDCVLCERAHGYRYAAIETDVPGAPPGTEHAVRVNVSVVRRPDMICRTELLARRALLPLLLVGVLPTTAQAQWFSRALREEQTTVRAAELAQRLLDEHRPQHPHIR